MSDTREPEANSPKSRPAPDSSVGKHGVSDRPADVRDRIADRAAERRALVSVTLDLIAERKSIRRWQWLRRFAAFGLLLAAGVLAWSRFDMADITGPAPQPVVAQINLEGVIESGGDIDAASIVPALESAFEDPDTVAVVLSLDSPGGSPVQSGQIADEIHRLRAAYPGKPLYAVVQEICASGCYYIASAAQEILVDRASIVGSIGVLLDSFGFVDLMSRLGIERRLFTAGEHKGGLDPFSPLDAGEAAHIRTMLDEIHTQFIDVVRKGRGARLKDSPDLFTGRIWSGQTGVELGLADSVGSVGSLLRDRIKITETRDFTPRMNMLDELASQFGARFGAAFGQAMVTSLRDSLLR